jgi:hypothetical protein
MSYLQVNSEYCLVGFFLTGAGRNTCGLAASLMLHPAYLFIKA